MGYDVMQSLGLYGITVLPEVTRCDVPDQGHVVIYPGMLRVAAKLRQVFATVLCLVSVQVPQPCDAQECCASSESRPTFSSWKPQMHLITVREWQSCVKTCIELRRVRLVTRD